MPEVVLRLRALAVTGPVGHQWRFAQGLTQLEQFGAVAVHFPEICDSAFQHQVMRRDTTSLLPDLLRHVC